MSTPNLLNRLVVLELHRLQILNSLYPRSESLLFDRSTQRIDGQRLADVEESSHDLSRAQNFASVAYRGR